MLGFAQGVTQENTVGFTEDGGYTTELRSENEQIKHKIFRFSWRFIFDRYKSSKSSLPNLSKRSRSCSSCKTAKMLKKN